MTSSPHPSPTGGLPDLAFVAVCAGCEKTFVSALRPFPDIYRCSDCLTALDRALERRRLAQRAAYLRRKARRQEEDLG